MRQYYTYVYFDSSRNLEPIYVGKGYGKRAYKHLLRKDKHPFTQRLQKMAENGIEPQIEIINCSDEEFALFLEEEIIALVGRKDLCKGPLLNLTDGGEGNTNSIRTEEFKENLRRIHKGKCPANLHSEEALLKAKETRKKNGTLPKKEDRPNFTRKGALVSEETKMKQRLSHNPNPVTINGIEYVSMGIASKELGFTVSKIKCAIRKQGNRNIKI